MIKKIHISNFKSIIETTVDINDNIYVLAGQNEAGKSSILEAIKAYEDAESEIENLNFELEDKGNLLQKISITYATEESFFEKIYKEMIDLVDDEFKKIDFSEIPLLDKLKFNKIKSFTITRVFDLSKQKDKDGFERLELDKSTLNIFRSCINSDVKSIQDVGHKIIIKNTPYINVSENINDIAYSFWRFTPKITLFNDFIDILPDSILISDLDNEKAKGYNAVKKIESLLNQDFLKLSRKSNAQKKSSVEMESRSISATLQKDWKQKINNQSEIKIIFDLQNDENGSPIVFFYLESKEGVLLEPRKRSKGMIWFLSLWLELKSNEDKSNMVLLFDEPGLHLHVKANNDMLNVFKRLKEKGHQIIYSTHLPSLIETDKLHNIGLVLNTNDKGTIVEGLTSCKLDTVNKKDALQPISEAMGLMPLKEFSVLSEKNVILEGLSDFWYFKGMQMILKRKSNYKFIPSIGIKSSKVFPIISFCIGYGLDWLLIMENGQNPLGTRNELNELLFEKNEALTDTKIKILDFKEVEDMFSKNDFLLIDNKFNINSGTLPSNIIGNRKIIYSKEFYNKVDNKEITIDQLDKKTIDNFNAIFDFIDGSFLN